MPPLTQNVQFPCLYCGDLSRPRTSEHVLQKAFGGNLTLPMDVCTDCNTDVFSPLDTKLVALARELIYAHHPDNPRRRTVLHSGMPLWLDPNTALWHNVRIDTEYRALPLTQAIYDKTNNMFQFVLDPLSEQDPQARVESFIAELCDPSLLKISEQLVTDHDPVVQQALVWSAPRKFVVRAGTKSQLSELRSAVESGHLGSELRSGLCRGGLSGGSTPKTNENPTFEWILKHDLDAYERAMAKTALNFACAVLGPEIVREERFDPMRRFALTGAPPDPCTVCFLFDPKTAAGYRPFADSLGQPGHHTLALMCDNTNCFGVMILLYNQPFGWVDLVESGSADDLRQRGFAVGWFDYKAKTHKIVQTETMTLAELQEFARRAKLRGGADVG